MSTLRDFSASFAILFQIMARPQLNSESGTVTASISNRKRLTFNVDFLRMQLKSFRLHSAEGADYHVEQGHPVFFARDPIGIAYNPLPTMFTSAIHKFPLKKRHFNIRLISECKEKYSRLIQKFWQAVVEERLQLCNKWIADR